MKVRALSMVLSLAALQWVGSLHSQNGPATPSLEKEKEEIRRNAREAQQELARQFATFQEQVLTLKNRLNLSPDFNDKSRAAQLQKVLEHADDLGIRIKFARLEQLLSKPKFENSDFQLASQKTDELAKDLAILIDLFDSRNNNLNEEVTSVRKMLKELDNIIKEQQRVEAITSQKKTGKEENVDLQKNITGDTKILEDALNPNKKEAKIPTGGETKDMKSQPKEGAGEQKSEARDAGEKKKPAEAREENTDPDGKKSGEAKGDETSKEKKTTNPEGREGEKKPAQAVEDKEASAKNSKNPKGSQAEAKEAKGSENKSNSKDAGKKDGSEPKAKETGEAKGTEKAGDKNPSNPDGKPEAKEGEKKGNKGSDTKEASAKNSDSPKGSQADPKEAKGSESKGNSKDAGKKDGMQPKNKEAGEAKGSEKASDKKPGGQEAKEGEKKGAKGSDNKEASAKNSDSPKGSQADPKDAKGSESKPGSSKDAGQKDGMQPKSKETGEAKGVDKNKGPEKNAEKSPKAEAKTNEKTEGDKQPSAKDKKEAGNPEAKQPPSDSKDAGKESKQAEAKSGDPKGEQKSSAKAPPKGGNPMDGGQPMPPMPGDDQPQAKGDKNDKSQSPPKASDNNEKDPPIGKKQIQDAIDKMERAEKKIKQGENDEASEEQTKAIEDLKEAKKILEKRLQQLREEELERLLANLKARCERMLSLQIAVLEGVEGTRATFRSVESNSDKKPNDANRQASIKLATAEKEIVIEATKAIEVLEGEGTAVAFHEAFKAVRVDMQHVQRRLDGADVGIQTQNIEVDIIDALKEMIEVLKKKEKEMEDKKEKEKDKKDKKPQDDKQQGPPPDQKLLDQIAELKMIRSMQVRLNKRTEDTGKRFPGQEQPADLNIRIEIRDLRERQETIFDITNKIQKGDNK